MVRRDYYPSGASLLTDSRFHTDLRYHIYVCGKVFVNLVHLKFPPLLVTMPQIRNPILPGFNADPSILRVGEDYYIATSTFEWYPGVQIHHSKDLANWDLVIRPLNRKAQLDMRGEPDSCGVWAPCLTHDGEKFWLVYTDVRRKDGSFKDTHNYIVTAPKIEGPWYETENAI